MRHAEPYLSHFPKRSNTYYSPVCIQPGHPCKTMLPHTFWISWQSLLHLCFAKCMKLLCMLFATGEREGAWQYPTYDPDYLQKARQQQPRRSSLQQQPSERHTRRRLGAVSFQEKGDESHYIPVDFGCRRWWKRRARVCLVCRVVHAHCCLVLF